MSRKQNTSEKRTFNYLALYVLIFTLIFAVSFVAIDDIVKAFICAGISGYSFYLCGDIGLFNQHGNPGNRGGYK